MTESTDEVLVELTGEVLHITLNRPQVRNALSDSVLDQLLDITGDLPSAARAIVIRGRGDVFCAGGDVKQFESTLRSATEEEIAAYNRRFGTVLERLTNSPAPVIAAVQGAAMAGGMGLAAAADITIGTRDAKFALTETRLGLIPAQICAFIVARIGPHQARRLMITASRIDAEAARRLGLIDDISDDLDADIAGILDRIRSCAPGANAMTKELVADASSGTSLTEVLDRAARLFADSMKTDEALEGIRSFTDKHRPSWLTDEKEEAQA